MHVNCINKHNIPFDNVFNAFKISSKAVPASMSVQSVSLSVCGQRDGPVQSNYQGTRYKALPSLSKLFKMHLKAVYLFVNGI